MVILVLTLYCFSLFAQVAPEVIDLTQTANLALLHLDTLTPEVVSGSLENLKNSEDDCEEEVTQTKKNLVSTDFNLSCQIQMVSVKPTAFTMKEFNSKLDWRPIYNIYKEERLTDDNGFDPVAFDQLSIEQKVEAMLAYTYDNNYFSQHYYSFSNIYGSLSNTDNQTFAATYEKLIQCKNAEERAQVYKSLNLSYEDKLKLAALLGKEASLNYNYGLKVKNQPNYDVDQIFMSMRMQDPTQSGVCTHAALMQAEALKAMGVSPEDIYIVGYSVPDSAHAVTRVEGADQSQTINWSHLTTKDAALLPDYSITDGNLTSIGISANVFDLNGKMLYTQNLPLGDYLANASGSRQFFVNPQNHLNSETNKLNFNTPLYSQSFIWGTTAEGHQISGFMVGKDVKNFENKAIIYSTQFGADGEKSDSLGLYLNHSFLKEFTPITIGKNLTWENQAGYSFQAQVNTSQILKLAPSGETAIMADGSLRAPVETQLRYTGKKLESTLGAGVELAPGLTDIRRMVDVKAYRPMINSYKVFSDVTTTNGKLHLTNTYYVIPGIHQSLIQSDAKVQIAQTKNVSASANGQVNYNLTNKVSIISLGANVQLTCFAGKEMETDVSVGYKKILSNTAMNQTNQFTLCVSLGN